MTRAPVTFFHARGGGSALVSSPEGAQTLAHNQRYIRDPTAELSWRHRS